ncbi:thioredoxin family protein [Sphingomonas sp. CGMCC 1.13654]|uniref:Thioredoxin family protein n=1 Tax=Sphingomonas chungangi TaxID=2683589 RepID=A0A838L0S7_9SPHN|nr:thioredoxin family protein [Sphingomonas chungangi]MBA2932540.1 thioredoxin family protein [Sphingomonas chungangi]MVW56163.1 thiol reductase thioredoxin [Sphingomonas chungangi]
MIKSLAYPLFAVALLASPATAVPQAPRISAATVNDLPQPLPFPYDEQADAQAAVAKARAQAKREHKRLLIDLGGNWCLDCRVLAGIMELPELQPFLDRHFVIVKVDIGRYDKNGDIAGHYGIAGRLDGVPALLAVDPVRDRLLNRDKLFALADARHMTPQGLADWLAQWAA